MAIFILLILMNLKNENIEYLVAMNVKVNESSWIWHNRLVGKYVLKPIA